MARKVTLIPHGGSLGLPQAGTPINYDSDTIAGLIASYPVVEGGGVQLEDVIGSHHCTLNLATAGLASGGFFRGTDNTYGPYADLSNSTISYGRIPYHPELDLSTAKSFVISCWVFFTSGAKDGAIVSCFKNTPSNYSGYMLWIQTAADEFAFFANGSDICHVSLFAGWQFLLAFWDGANAYVFLVPDGTQSIRTASAAFAGPVGGSSADTIVGAYYINGNDTGGTPGFILANTKIFDLRIYRNVIVDTTKVQLLADPATRWSTGGGGSSSGGSSPPPSLGGGGLHGLSALSGLNPITLGV